MSTAAIRYTPEDLLSMPDGELYELVNGELLERKMGFESGRIGGRVFRLVDEYCDSNPIGRAGSSESSFQCFPNEPGMVRKPDASFISFARLPADQPDPRGHCRIAPDLAAEVISPNDIIDELHEKIDDYKSAGVRLIWVFDPRWRNVNVYRADGTAEVIPANGELSGEDVLPGFRKPVAAFFPSPVAKA